MKKIAFLLFILSFMFFISCDFFLDILLMRFPKDFDKITYEDIKEALENGDIFLNNIPISKALLLEGEILLYKTNMGNFGKLKVNYINEQNHFSFDYVTFDIYGAFVVEKSNATIIEGYYDLDLKPDIQTGETGCDFFWGYDEYSEGNSLKPMEPAVFGFSPNSGIPVYKLCLEIQGSGSVYLSPPSICHELDGKYYYHYYKNMRVELFPAPDDGWMFDVWTGDNVVNEYAIWYIFMDGDKSIKANFIQNSKTVSIYVIAGNETVVPGEVAKFDLFIDPIPTSPITINFSISGNAVEGSDYQSIGTSFTTSNQNAQIFIQTLAGAIVGKQITVTLNSVDSGYTIDPNNSSATITISNSIKVMHSACDIPNDSAYTYLIGEVPQGYEMTFDIYNLSTISTIDITNITMGSINGFYISNYPDPPSINPFSSTSFGITCSYIGTDLESDIITIESNGIPNTYQFKIKCTTTTGPTPMITATPGYLEESIFTQGALEPNVITVDLMDGTFALMNIPTCVNLINLPAGLTRGTVTYLNPTQISVEILGTANPHTNNEDTTFYVEIIPDGITGYTGAVSSNFIQIDFDPIKVIPSPSILNESASNNGTMVSGSISLNLYNGTYISVPPITMANILVNNLPTGLIINTVNPISSTELELVLTGAAIAHGTINNTELFFTLVAGTIEGIAFDVVSIPLPIVFIDSKGN